MNKLLTIGKVHKFQKHCMEHSKNEHMDSKPFAIV